MGTSLGVLQLDCLSNLRFADDVLLCSTSLQELRNMMCDFKKKNTENVGLKNHLEKTTIVSKQRLNRRNEVTIDNNKVEVLPVKERAKYLCQSITLEQQETTEIKNRIRAAWASLTKYRQELTSKTYLPTTQASLVQRGHHSYTCICL